MVTVQSYSTQCNYYLLSKQEFGYYCKSNFTDRYLLANSRVIITYQTGHLFDLSFYLVKNIISIKNSCYNRAYYYGHLQLEQLPDSFLIFNPGQGSTGQAQNRCLLMRCSVRLTITILTYNMISRSPKKRNGIILLIADILWQTNQQHHMKDIIHLLEYKYY